MKRRVLILGVGRLIPILALALLLWSTAAFTIVGWQTPDASSGYGYQRLQGVVIGLGAVVFIDGSREGSYAGPVWAGGHAVRGRENFHLAHHGAPMWLRPGFTAANGLSIAGRKSMFGDSVSIPCWIIVMAAFLPNALHAMITSVNSRRRIAAGLCTRCGYDLRATPDRCPECGTVQEMMAGNP